MSQEIGDEAAIRFSVGFYDALGAGETIEYAYKLGCSLIRIAGISEELTPKLLTNKQLDGEEFRDISSSDVVQNSPQKISVYCSSSTQQNIASETLPSVHNWDGVNEEKLYKDPLDTSINSIDISADGQILVSGDVMGVIRVWNLNSKNEIHAFRGHEDSVNSVAINSACNIIISGGKSGNGKIWRIPTDSTLTPPELLLHNSKWHSTAIHSIAISKDSASPIIVSGSEGGTVEVKSLNLNATDARTLFNNRYNFKAFERYRKSVRSLGLSANGQVLVLSTGTKIVKVWYLNTIREFPYDFPEMHNESVSAVAISPDGQTVISGDESGQMKIWNLKTNSKKSCHSTSAINYVAMVNGGHFFVSGNKDGQVEVWDSIKGIMVAHIGGHARPVRSVAVSADVRVVASSSQNGEIKVWRPQI